mmetsp:Transcript_23501/g.56213  ORF Transcript_23501/g.56213 Transcript_23501/m.56213 type:complete len:310 (-) Transcript_23501:544-1473(-)
MYEMACPSSVLTMCREASAQRVLTLTRLLRQPRVHVVLRKASRVRPILNLRHSRIQSSKNSDSNESEKKAESASSQIYSDQRTVPQVLDPVKTVSWGGRLPSTRRAVLGFLGGFSIAFFANFAGISSFLLSLDGGNFARALRLDVLIPVSGFKRCFVPRDGFELLVPRDWLADQTLYRRAAARAERSLDPPSLRDRRPRKDKFEPVAGFGPPGTSGEDNLSVIVAPIQPGKALSDLGSPETVGEGLLQRLAPPGSQKETVLIAAGQEMYATIPRLLRKSAHLRSSICLYLFLRAEFLKASRKCFEENVC